jgi:hypothetical protein
MVFAILFFLSEAGDLNQNLQDFGSRYSEANARERSERSPLASYIIKGILTKFAF